MIRKMFSTFGMEESRRDDYDIDACLEHSEEDLHEYFIEFYHDVLPEFRSVGKVVQFKVRRRKRGRRRSCFLQKETFHSDLLSLSSQVSRNYEPHLRGNVYVQFDT